MTALARDVRLTLRQLARNRAFSVVVVLTMGICVGANVATFSVVNAVVLRPLPYPDADRLVTINNSYPGGGVERASNAAIDYFFRRERVQALEEVAAYQQWGHTVGEAGSTDRVRTTRVTPSFFPLLGVEPALGRSFTEEEMWPDQAQKVVLTYGYWLERGGDAQVLGSELRVDGRPYIVVGVLPDDFRWAVQPDTRFFVPIPFTDEERTIESWHNNSYQMLARLRDGATIDQATAQIGALNASLIDESVIPNARQLLADLGYHTVLVSASNDLVRDVRPLLIFLWVGVALVLLIGCVNVANLMLARSHVRTGEFATRLTLGAGRPRLVRQFLTEGAVVAVLGGTLGVALGALGLRALMRLGLGDLPRGPDVAVDGPVLAFTLALSLGAAVLFGTVPGIHVLRGDLGDAMRVEGRGGTGGRGAVLLRSGLVTVQVALSFLLLVGAGLIFRSFRSAVAVDHGFGSADVVTAEISLPSARYPDGDSRRAFSDELLAELRSLPGVRAAGITSELPFSGSSSSSVIFPEAYEPGPGESLLSPFRTEAGPGYFEAMEIDVLEDRAFEQRDGPDASNVIVIDEWLARRFWPDGSPLGERMITGVAPGDPDIDEDNIHTVIGVVETVKQNDLTSDDHVGAYYFTYRQRSFSDLTAVLRTTTSTEQVSGALRQALTRLDPELPLYDVRTMEDRLSGSLVARRAAMLLLGTFSAVALFLATVGLYGVLSYSVTQRRREVGIRVAVGGTPGRIFRMVLRQGLQVTLLGLLLGAAAALGFARLIRSLLFGVEPADSTVLLVTVFVLGAAAIVACVVPAWRATRIDPSVALQGG